MPRSIFLYAAPDTSADLLHATGFRAPDPFAFLETAGRRAVLLSDLEIDRAKTEARVDDIESFSELERSLGASSSVHPPLEAVLAAWLASKKVKAVRVPADFPFGLARALKKHGIDAKPAKGALYPERELKAPAEIEGLAAATALAETGMARAMEVLRGSSIRRDQSLVWCRKPLTSEILRFEIECAILRAGGEARGDSIVACGEQACDPHARGTGPLKARQLIIVDIFPRHARSGWFGDITRTVVRGRPSEAQQRLWETCLEGQRIALGQLAPGVAGRGIHNGVKDFFTRSGYPTRIHNGRWEGFFHGTGHGLGLEIHESPRFAEATFQPGHVVTVEPGLYIPGTGGVRHEDVAVVTATGSRLLTSFPKELAL